VIPLSGSIRVSLDCEPDHSQKRDWSDAGSRGGNSTSFSYGAADAASCITKPETETETDAVVLFSVCVCMCVFRVIVGAPRDNVTDGSAAERLIRPGAVYQCPFTSSESDCASIVIDREGITAVLPLLFGFDSTAIRGR